MNCKVDCVHLKASGDCFLAELDGYKRVECIELKDKVCEDKRSVNDYSK